MPGSGLALDSGVLTTLTTTIGGIAATIVNYAPQMIIAGIAIWGILLVFKKLPQWIKTFAR